jgi:hypothetical protein
VASYHEVSQLQHMYYAIWQSLYECQHVSSMIYPSTVRGNKRPWKDVCLLLDFVKIHRWTQRIFDMREAVNVPSLASYVTVG